MYIGNVIHQANIDVDETWHGGRRSHGRRHDDRRLRVPCPLTAEDARVDQPFMYFIRDCRPARSCSWAGSPTRPSASEPVAQRGLASQAFQVSSALPAVTRSP